MSDSDYFTDLGTDFTQNTTTTKSVVPSLITGKIHGQPFAWQGFQTIDKLLTDADKPYARLPQLLLNNHINLPYALKGDIVS